MSTLNELQKALLKNILRNYKRGMNIWIEKETQTLPDNITVFFEEKTGITFEGLAPKGDEAVDFAVAFEMFLDYLISDVENNNIQEKNFADISFMLENQNWMPESNISDEVVRLANFPFPKYIETRTML